MIEKDIKTTKSRKWEIPEKKFEGIIMFEIKNNELTKLAETDNVWPNVQIKQKKEVFIFF